MHEQAPAATDGVEYIALSDVGLRRANNQDSYAVSLAGSSESFQQTGHLFLVADGMGAHAAGELASKLSADIVPLAYRKTTGMEPWEAIRQAILQANERIHGRGEAHAEFHGMGTTTSTLLLLPEGAVVAHVGDSRVYRLRGSRLEQLSFDHSLVWEMMVTSGHVREDQVPGFIPRNIITRSLGPSAAVEVDLEGPFPIEQGDTFLLCSDGLSGQVQDAELGAILWSLEPAQAARALVDMANLRGGPDNITVIVARVKSAQLATRGGRGSRSFGGSGRTLAPWFWVILGTLLAATLASGLAGHAIAAAVAGVASLATAIAGVVWRGAGGGSSAEVPSALGRGPYREWECKPDEPLVKRLANVVSQVREAANEGKWQVDWAKFDAFHAQASDAVAKRDYPRAYHAYLQAMQFLMETGRQQSARPPAQ